MSVPRLSSCFTFHRAISIFERSIAIRSSSFNVSEKGEEEKAIKANREAQKAEKQRIAIKKKLRKKARRSSCYPSGKIFR